MTFDICTTGFGTLFCFRVGLLGVAATAVVHTLREEDEGEKKQEKAPLRRRKFVEKQRKSGAWSSSGTIALYSSTEKHSILQGLPPSPSK